MKEQEKEKLSRIIADCPPEAYYKIKMECVKRRIPVGTVVKLAVNQYLELNLDDRELGVE